MSQATTDAEPAEDGPDSEPSEYSIPDACFVCGEEPTWRLPQTLQRSDSDDAALGAMTGAAVGVGYRRYDVLDVELPFCAPHAERVRRVLAGDLKRNVVAFVLMLPVLGGGIYLAFEQGAIVAFLSLLVCIAFTGAAQFLGRKARRDAGLEVRLVEHLGRLVLERHDPRTASILRIPLRDLRVRRAH